MDYLDLDLLIDCGPDGRCSVHADAPGLGEASGEFVLGTTLPEADATTLENDEPGAGFLAALGSQLYTRLFESGGQLLRGTGGAFTAGDSVEALFNQCLGAARTRAGGVRVRLRIDTGRAATIPWEFVRSPQLDRFLAANAETPVVRYLELNQPIHQLRITLPPALLVVIPETVGLDSKREREYLERAMAGFPGGIEYRVLDGRVTRARLRAVLREREWHVLHYIGHGDFDGDRAVLLLNGEDGSDDRIDHESLHQMLGNHRSLKLVVLNSCLGATVSSSSPFLGMAPQLVRAGVPAVIAMQYVIRDDEAICFAREFYGELLSGRQPGRIEIAASHARSALIADFRDRRAFGAPVLFLRAPEGVLFELPAAGAMPGSPDRVQAARAVERTRDHNVKALEARMLEAPDAETGDELDRERAELDDLRRRIRLRLRAGAAAAVFATLLFAAAWLGAFTILPGWLRPETYALWIGDAFIERRFDDRIVMVAIDSATERIVGRPFGRDWRPLHARLVDRLSAAGAKVIAFDIVFDEPGDDGLAVNDSVLGAAFGTAASRGTAVVVAVDRRDAGAPDIIPELRAAATTGIACVGRHSAHTSTIAPLVVLEPDGTRTPAFPLAAAMRLRDQEIGGLEVAERRLLLTGSSGSIEPVRFAEAERLSEAQRACPIIGAGAVVANLLIDYSPLDTLRSGARRLRYETLVADPGPDLPDLAGRLVIVGGALEVDAYTRLRGPFLRETRYGFELHADAVNTLLLGIAIRPASNGVQFLLVLAMSLAGAAIATAPRAGRRRRMLLLAGAALACTAVSSFVYVASRITLTVVLQLAALLSAYAAGRRLRQWVFP
jgi:CHASE2 domain-containing sensor protein